MKKVRKAVITAAGRGTRHYPATNAVQKEMFPLVDRDGVTKPTIQLVVEEALSAGIQEVCIVTSPGADAQIRAHFQPIPDANLPAYQGKAWALEQSERLADMAARISYATQETPEGFGHAVHCARGFVGEEPFLLMLGDHVYISREERSCARQVTDRFTACGATVTAVQQTPASQLHLFGTIQGEPTGTPGLYRAAALYEKPSPECAREHLATPGLPPDTYLCLFGLYAFTPGIFSCLEEQISSDARQHGEIQLMSAQAMLRDREPYFACEVNGRRYDMGVPEGYIETQMALGGEKASPESESGV
jgi:UTP--glucose-1-phosphate uridylyltransferase